MGIGFCLLASFNKVLQIINGPDSHARAEARPFPDEAIADPVPECRFGNAQVFGTVFGAQVFFHKNSLVEVVGALRMAGGLLRIKPVARKKGLAHFSYAGPFLAKLHF